jgi:thiol-disulfide isomerase/thioredoxin
MAHTLAMLKMAAAMFVSLVACVGIGAAAEEKAPVATGVRVGQRLPQFTARLLDPSSATARPSEIDSHRREHLTAYVVIGTRCPATQAYAERLSELERSYAPKQVDFVYVYPNREDTPETKLAFHQEKRLRGRLIDDQGGRVARLLGAQRTSEVVLTDRRGTIVYRGAIDDSRQAAGVKQRYLATALDETLAGKPVAVATTPVQA